MPNRGGVIGKLGDVALLISDVEHVEYFILSGETLDFDCFFGDADSSCFIAGEQHWGVVIVGGGVAAAAASTSSTVAGGGCGDAFDAVNPGGGFDGSKW